MREEDPNSYGFIPTSDDRDLYARVKGFMLEYWGERCKLSDPGCVLCKAWSAFDTIFEGLEI